MNFNFLKSPLAAVFLVALLIRLVGVQWGLPNEIRMFTLHPDEQDNLMFARQINPVQLDFLPGFYNYGTLYLTLLRVVSDIVITYSGGLDASGVIPPAMMGSIHLGGRILNCFFGAGVAVMTAAIAGRIFGQRQLWIAGGLVSVAAALTVHSRFQTVDMLACLLIMCALYAAVRILDEGVPTQKWAIWGGVFVGLSAGTKYVGAVAIFVVMGALMMRKQPKLAVVAVLAALVSFVVSTPGCIFEREVFIRDFTFELNHSKEGHGIVFMGTAPAPVYHMYNLMLGSGLLVLLGGVIGMVVGSVKKDRAVGLTLLLFALYFAAISGGQIKFMRYTLPLIPCLVIGVCYLLKQMEERGLERASMALGAAVILGLDFGGLVRTASFTGRMLVPDTRDVAGRKIKEEFKAENVGLVNDPWFWSATLHPEMPVMRRLGPRRLMELWQSWTDPRVLRYIPANPDEPRIEWDVRLIREMDPEYITFSSLEYAPLDRISAIKNKTGLESLFAGRYQEFMAELQSKYDLVWKTEIAHDPIVEDMEYVQPDVLIWKRKTN